MHTCVCVFAVQVLPINKAALRIDIYSINLLLPPAAATALAATATAAAIFHSFIKKATQAAHKSWPTKADEASSALSAPPPKRLGHRKQSSCYKSY